MRLYMEMIRRRRLAMIKPVGTESSAFGSPAARTRTIRHSRRVGVSDNFADRERPAIAIAPTRRAKPAIHGGGRESVEATRQQLIQYFDAFYGEYLLHVSDPRVCGTAEMVVSLGSEAWKPAAHTIALRVTGSRFPTIESQVQIAMVRQYDAPVTVWQGR